MKKIISLFTLFSLTVSMNLSAETVTLPFDAQNGAAPASIDVDFKSQEIREFFSRSSVVNVTSVNFKGGPSSFNFIEPLSDIGRVGSRGGQLFIDGNNLVYKHPRSRSLDRTFIFEAPISSGFIASVTGRSLEGCDRTSSRPGTLLVRAQRMVVLETTDGASHLLTIDTTVGARPETPLIIDQDGMYTRKLGMLSCITTTS